MELVLDGDTRRNRGMRICHETMLKNFKNTVTLVNYGGPVQMCVFYLEYEYSKKPYKIILECERGFLTIEVEDQAGNVFFPGMIYPGARRHYFEDMDEDIEQLVQLTYRAFEKNEVRFSPRDKIKDLDWD